eukprot:c5666_g1_i2.p1 GENE.c5666_g1_i2~~c5666_g1_i2.p1  ORF type:complete len:369 (-),score=68.17 c5666_g1_i2:37-1143(-)
MRVDLAGIKHRLARKIGEEKWRRYWGVLRKFLRAKLSKVEFDQQCLELLHQENIGLHNTLVRGIIHNAYEKALPHAEVALHPPPEMLQMVPPPPPPPVVAQPPLKLVAKVKKGRKPAVIPPAPSENVVRKPGRPKLVPPPSPTEPVEPVEPVPPPSRSRGRGGRGKLRRASTQQRTSAKTYFTQPPLVSAIMGGTQIPSRFTSVLCTAYLPMTGSATVDAPHSIQPMIASAFFPDKHSVTTRIKQITSNHRLTFSEACPDVILAGLRCFLTNLLTKAVAIKDADEDASRSRAGARDYFANEWLADDEADQMPYKNAFESLYGPVEHTLVGDRSGNSLSLAHLHEALAQCPVRERGACIDMVERIGAML